MSITDFIKPPQKTTNRPSDILQAHRKAGTEQKTVKFYPPAATGPSLLSLQNPETKPVAELNFFQRTADNVKALQRGDFSFKDVVKEMPGVTVRGAVKAGEIFAPALTKFAATTGSIIGEGLAYATSKDVREQYEKGNLDILPTVTNTTPAKLAKYTFAAGLETAIFKSFPKITQMQLANRFSAGSLQGVGFAISEGLANDKTPEEIFKSMPTYGLSGGALSIVAPYLMPLLRGEVANMPQEIRNMFKGIQSEIKPPKPPVPPDPTKINVISQFPDTTAVPISTPNKRYEAYLRSQGYEPYIPEKELPVVNLEQSPKRDFGGAVDANNMEAPNVYGPDSLYDNKYTPDNELPVINSRGEMPAPKKEAPAFTEMVPEPKPKAPTQTPEEEIMATVAPEPKKVTVKTEPKATVVNETRVEGESRTTTVSRDILPVQSEGKVKVSRLESRMQNSLDEINESGLDAQNQTVYRELNNKEQIAKSSKYVIENGEEDALAILRGDKQAPDGILHNAIYLALSKQAEITANAKLALKLASLRSTRAGQEIQILANAEPDGFVSSITEIIKARTTRAGRKKMGKPTKPEDAEKMVSSQVKSDVKKVTDDVNKMDLKIAEAEKILTSIPLC